MKVLSCHLMRSKTRAGTKCIILHFFTEGNLYRQWLMRNDMSRATFFRRNVVEEIDLDFSQSKTFPKINITKMSLRTYSGNECHHIWIDGDLKSDHYYCTDCGETIDVYNKFIQSSKSYF